MHTQIYNHRTQHKFNYNCTKQQNFTNVTNGEEIDIGWCNNWQIFNNVIGNQQHSTDNTWCYNCNKQELFQFPNSQQENSNKNKQYINLKTYSHVQLNNTKYMYYFVLIFHAKVWKKCRLDYNLLNKYIYMKKKIVNNSSINKLYSLIILCYSYITFHNKIN